MDGRAETADFQDEAAAEDPQFKAFLASLPAEKRIPKPIIPRHLIFFWNAWGEIRDERDVSGFGAVGPLRYAALSAYAADHHIVGEEFLIFKTLMMAMDQTYMKYVAKTLKKPKAE